jgi:hypothetical protein
MGKNIDIFRVGLRLFPTTGWLVKKRRTVKNEKHVLTKKKVIILSFYGRTNWERMA